MQYFLGYKEYRPGKPFVPSLIVEFRKRLNLEEILQIIDETDDDVHGTPGATGECEAGGDGQKSSGALLIDATCAPSDIRYPTDLNLLNEGREKLEEIVDTLWENMQDKPTVKPRTHREEARKQYLKVEKQCKSSYKVVRKAIGKQLRYIQRDFGIIKGMCRNGQLISALTARQYRNLLVIAELYRQQQEMFENKKHSIDDRIVSISQPHVRPIVRGKASAPVEFGAKIAVSKVNGICR